MMRNTLDELTLRNLVCDEALTSLLMQEGLWDDVKSGVLALRRDVAQKFKGSIAQWFSSLRELIDNVDLRKDEIDEAMAIVKDAIQESGENFKFDETLKTAKELSVLTPEDYLDFVQQDLEGPVHDLASELQHNAKKEVRFHAGLCRILMAEGSPADPCYRLNEEVAALTIAGLLLGGYGALHLVFKGLAKMALHLNMQKTAKLFAKWAKVLHHVEEKTLDFVIPDKLAYVFYRLGSSVAVKTLPFVFTKKHKMLDFEHFKKNHKILMMTKHTMYKILLAWLLFNGLVGAINAGISVLGVAEGSASMIKGVEVATGVGELVATARGIKT